jgi:hypothetical protein
VTLLHFTLGVMLRLVVAVLTDVLIVGVREKRICVLLLASFVPFRLARMFRKFWSLAQNSYLQELRDRIVIGKAQWVEFYGLPQIEVNTTAVKTM